MLYLVNILVLIIIAGIGIWVGRRLAMRNVFGKINRERSTHKRMAKQKILEHLARTRQRSIGNNEVEKLVGVSDSTATVYLRELVNEGKLERIGEEGRYVSYRLK